MIPSVDYGSTGLTGLWIIGEPRCQKRSDTVSFLGHSLVNRRISVVEDAWPKEVR